MTTVNGQNVDELFQTDSFKKSLKSAEHVIQYVNKQYISINDSDYTVYANHLKAVLSTLVPLMKKADTLFNNLYQKEHFAGSYADKLKIGKPTEYDMNLIIKLPVSPDNLEFEDAAPSFIKIKVNRVAFEKASTDLKGWVDDEGYLLQTKFRDWMESVLTKALNPLELDESPEGNYGNTRCLKVRKDNAGEQVYKIGHKKSGPAMTLKVVTPDNCALDVDLVPAFQFGHPKWPTSVIPLPETSANKSWVVIPKPKKLKDGVKLEVNDTREWRMSFLDQEREIIKESGTVKPTIKLLKKLRDTNSLKQLSSYAIKTVVMLEMEKNQPDFWKNRSTFIFLFMLNRLIGHIKSGHIPFFWDKRDDLLKMGKTQAENVGGCLTRLLKDMVKNVESNPCIIAEKLLSKDEYNDFVKNYKQPNGTMPVTTKNSEEDKMVAPITFSQNVSGQDEVDNLHETLSALLRKLDKIEQGQGALPAQLLQAIFIGREPEQLAKSSGQQENHTGCLQKQHEQEVRIKALEDVVNSLQSQINLLSKFVVKGAPGY